jgi:hypothetical protein
MNSILEDSDAFSYSALSGSSAEKQQLQPAEDFPPQTSSPALSPDKLVR